jgi:hypothetical protein
MPNRDYRDLVLRDRKDRPVIADSKSKVSLPLAAEPFDIAGS